MKKVTFGQAACKPTGRSNWALIVFGAAMACAQATWAQGENQRIYQTYADSVAAAQRREPLGDQAFGEKIALFSGSTEFTITDITLPGNDDLPVALGRRFVVQDRNEYRDRAWLSNLGGFGDWDVEVPYLEGTFPAQLGWIVAPQVVRSPARAAGSPPMSTSPEIIPAGLGMTTFPGPRAACGGTTQVCRLPTTAAGRPQISTRATAMAAPGGGVAITPP